ncbi:MAG: hypothetical protein IKV41_05315 [Oscillospiraceae bacterium]|nr:hypothetical protein [Oscillospiraceae bacterium]
MMNYKGKPLVRKGNTLYYGAMSDSHVAMIQINKTHKACDLDMADSVTVQILSTDESLPIKDRVVKRTERLGLYEALHIADIWLARL